LHLFTKKLGRSCKRSRKTEGALYATRCLGTLDVAVDVTLSVQPKQARTRERTVNSPALLYAVKIRNSYHLFAFFD
jgi:hypothetical protein